MNREKTLQKLIKEASGSGYIKLANRIGINYVTLFRIVKGKCKNGGSAISWDAIFRYYK
jgi:predicted transcriptional regulator